ncbi:hypothetical protein C448_01314 [Halococcus morrhuae DSM 1307]|uniref:Uncharacterized protein n=1 Tax=Halococcus morrhuae DSM 1307 TaxID=931277 RepID=M0N1H3_HALMO|nr:hypothetical protein C448_01314 [Halococcus morrhuae DSM 1307]
MSTGGTPWWSVFPRVKRFIELWQLDLTVTGLFEILESVGEAGFRLAFLEIAQFGLFVQHPLNRPSRAVDSVSDIADGKLPAAIALCSIRHGFGRF